MLTWFKRFFRAFFFDAGAFEAKMRFFWGLLAGVASAVGLTIVAAAGADFNAAVEEIASWNKADWIIRLGVGVLFALANGRKTKTMSVEEIHAELAKRGAVEAPEEKP